MAQTVNELVQRESAGELSRDVIFATLSNQRRRFVIHFMKQHPEQVRIRDLSEQIAAWENDVAVSELNYKQRKRVYTSLHQTHLPKMDDAGIIEYDRDRGHITLAARSTDLDQYLFADSTDPLPWSKFYLGLSVAALCLVVVAWSGIVPASIVPPLGFAALIAVAFTIAAGVHTYQTTHDSADDTEAPSEQGNGTTNPPTLAEQAASEAEDSDDDDDDGDGTVREAISVIIDQAER